MELQPWVLNDELDRYFQCEAGVSPQCATRVDLDEVCASSNGESDLCAQCFDQLSNDLCGQVMSKCIDNLDDRYDDTCFAISEACQLRADCFEFDMYCSWVPTSEEGEDYYWECAPEDTAFCYQESSCIIQSLYGKKHVDDFVNDDKFDSYGDTHLETDEAYQDCILDGEYARWIEEHPTCDHSLGLELSDEAGTTNSEGAECDFKECERTYLFCSGEACEEKYINCVLMRDDY
jgi:hypothetical protein